MNEQHFMQVVGRPKGINQLPLKRHLAKADLWTWSKPLVMKHIHVCNKQRTFNKGECIAFCRHNNYSVIDDQVR